VNRVLAAVAAGLVAAFVAIGVLAGEEEEAPAPAREPLTERVADVAGDVERVRELEFDRLPRLKVVSPEEATRDSLREVDRYITRRRQRVEERLLRMLGLLPPDAGLRAILGEALSEEVAGYYLPRSDTMALIRGAGLGGLVAEVTLSHELTHALEDQHFDIESDEESLFLRDRAVALAALLEGSATVAMVDYVALTQAGTDELPAHLRAEVLDQFESVALPASSGLPRYVRESLIFPYAAGARFVNRVESRGGWAAVDRAFEEDPPVSTEQVLHPEKYEAGERPVPVRLRGRRPALPDGARVVARGDLGEFDTAQLLRDANGRPRAEEAAAGWGGSAFELWRLPGGGDALVMAWAWDTPRDAAEFEAAAELTVQRLGGTGAVNGSGKRVTVTLGI
jgi:hypothetical protein